MSVTISSQCFVFLQACLLGMGLGLFYDVFRILRRALPHPAAVIAAQDVLFFLICALASFVFLMAETDGRIRWFIAAGELLGAVVYHYTVGELVMAVADVVIGAVRWVLGLIRRLVCAVLGLLWRVTGAPAAALWQKTRPVAKKYVQNMKKALGKRKFGLKPRPALLYNPNKSSLAKKGGARRGKKKKT